MPSKNVMFLAYIYKIFKYISNISDKTQYYSSEFLKIRCEIQECENYQPCRVFIQNILAV